MTDTKLQLLMEKIPISSSSSILRSDLNHLIFINNFKLNDVLQMYRYISSNNIPILSDVPSSVIEFLEPVIHGTSWSENLLALINLLDSGLTLNDMYLFDEELEHLCQYTQNVKATIRKSLKYLIASKKIMKTSAGLYFPISHQHQVTAEDESGSSDFQDLDSLISSPNFQNELNQAKEVANFENNTEYLERFQGSRDTKSLELLVEANASLVKKIAFQYHNFAKVGYSLDDMVVEGEIGLLKAIEKFDLSLGNQFSTYATYWIRQAILRGLANQSTTVRLPVHLRNTIQSMHKTAKLLTDELSRSPSIRELAVKMNVSTKTIIQLQTIENQFNSNLPSLDKPVQGEQETTLLNLLPDQDYSVYDDIENADLTAQLDRLLATLTSRESEIIIQRFGLRNNEAMTLEELGKKYGLTRERIRQIEAKALKKMKRSSSEKYIDDWK
ncbi:sigma-70 family RNA polymerase sigma factor [Furfurilactobacillus milii]|nr:sigma-70 family RNA polymerase sigma factor [Furfurilactobacillus milii]